MSDLSTFLLARIAEDEAAARRVASGEPIQTLTPAEVFGARGLMFPIPRVLAKCAADRLIVETARDYSPELEHGDNGEWAFDATLRHLATVYADHPDYREEWRP